MTMAIMATTIHEIAIQTTIIVNIFYSFNSRAIITLIEIAKFYHQNSLGLPVTTR